VRVRLGAARRRRAHRLVAVTTIPSNFGKFDTHELYRYWRACLDGRPPSSNPLDTCDRTSSLHALRTGGRVAYEVYLRSQRWREFRAAMLELVGYKCERCGRTEAEYRLLVLDVHHWCYARLGCELPDDVEVLCRPCHEGADAERRQH
jgi:hypothetical protein